MSTASMSDIFDEGSPRATTKSACLPEASAMLSSDMNGLYGCEASFYQKFHFALITESCHNTADASRVRPR
jgi:hypothetical protein